MGVKMFAVGCESLLPPRQMFTVMGNIHEKSNYYWLPSFYLIPITRMLTYLSLLSVNLVGRSGDSTEPTAVPFGGLRR